MRLDEKVDSRSLYVNVVCVSVCLDRKAKDDAILFYKTDRSVAVSALSGLDSA